jgi:hypothetical protein
VIEITSSISKNVLTLGNTAICVDNVYIIDHVSIDFYFYPNPVEKILFGMNCL